MWRSHGLTSGEHAGHKPQLMILSSKTPLTYCFISGVHCGTILKKIPLFFLPQLTAKYGCIIIAILLINLKRRLCLNARFPNNAYDRDCLVVSDGAATCRCLPGGLLCKHWFWRGSDHTILFSSLCCKE